MRALEQAESLASGFEDVHLNLALAYLRSGQRDAAEKQLAIGVVAFMYTVVWDGLQKLVLKIAVATYVAVISMMAARSLATPASLARLTHG